MDCKLAIANSSFQIADLKSPPAVQFEICNLQWPFCNFPFTIDAMGRRIAPSPLPLSPGCHPVTPCDARCSSPGERETVVDRCWSFVPSAELFGSVWNRDHDRL